MKKTYAQRYRERRLKCIEILGGQCVDCGEDDANKLNFDHRIKGSKIHPLLKWETVLREISKCVLRCDLCHYTKHGPGWANNLPK